MTNLDYLYDKAAAQKFFGKNHFADKKLHFKIIERGTILPHKHLFVNGNWTWGFGGIVDRRGEFVKNSFVHEGTGAAYTPTEDVQHSPATVIYLGLFYPVWGHCLTDNLRRLWFLKSNVFKSYFKNCPLVYLSWGGVTVEHQKSFCRMLEILEIDVKRLQPITHPVQFENIILPDESFMLSDGERFFTDEYRETIERVKNFALKNQTPAPKKIYFFYGNVQIGEERIAEYFRSKGYEIISHEQRSNFDKELNLLINAESFASTMGSCAHNSIFLREGTETIFIPRSALKLSGGYQQSINQINNLNATYIDSSLSIFAAGNGPYCFIISRQLKNFFGDEFTGYTDDDFKIFLAYVQACMSRGFKPNENVFKYYAPMYQEFLTQLMQRKDLLKAYGVKL